MDEEEKRSNASNIFFGGINIKCTKNTKNSLIVKELVPQRFQSEKHLLFIKWNCLINQSNLSIGRALYQIISLEKKHNSIALNGHSLIFT